MKVTATLKKGVTFEEAMNVLVDIANKNQRIEDDLHTNKHYILKDGKMWKKGDGTGKYWDLFCNSREAQKDTRDTINIF